jgi:hypothetical protein
MLKKHTNLVHPENNDKTSKKIHDYFKKNEDLSQLETKEVQEVREEINNINNKCDQCDYNPESRTKLIQHIRNIHEVTEAKEETIKTDVYEQRVTCDQCDYKPKSSRNLIDHIRLKHNVRVNCSKCSKTFASKRTLEEHTRKYHVSQYHKNIPESPRLAKNSIKLLSTPFKRRANCGVTFRPNIINRKNNTNILDPSNHQIDEEQYVIPEVENLQNIPHPPYIPANEQEWSNSCLGDTSVTYPLGANVTSLYHHKNKDPGEPVRGGDVIKRVSLLEKPTLEEESSDSKLVVGLGKLKTSQ